jgi:drug/metabolite transporter (DMT)-like permease
VTAARRAEGILFLMTLVWGTTFTFSKILLDEMSPLQAIALRFLLSAIILGVLFGRSIFPLTTRQLRPGAILGVLLFAGFAVQNIGLGLTTASKSGFLTALTVVFVPLLQIGIEHKSPHWGNIAGALVVAAGLWMLTTPEGSAFNLGDALTLACALAFSFYMIYLDIFSGMGSVLQLTFVQVAVNAILAVMISMIVDPPLHAVSGGAVATVIYLTVFATVLTTLGQTRFQKDTTPTRAAIIFSGEPVIAAIVAAFVLHERLGSMGILGGALILIGILLSELSGEIPLLNRPAIRFSPPHRREQ